MRKISARGFLTLFQFTRSSRSATTFAPLWQMSDTVSIHALLAERDIASRLRRRGMTGVSIHALLAERDLSTPVTFAPMGSVSIHALLAERDTLDHPPEDVTPEFQFTRSSRSATFADRHAREALFKFQFTRSSRSATRHYAASLIPTRFQFTRSSRSATKAGARRAGVRICFNSRAPRGARHADRRGRDLHDGFNSRAPRGARPNTNRDVGVKIQVSIHALLAERDLPDHIAPQGSLDVSIHALLAERDAPVVNAHAAQFRFQFTRSSRSATSFPLMICAICLFQFTRSSRSATAGQSKLSPRNQRFQFTRSSRSATRRNHCGG